MVIIKSEREIELMKKAGYAVAQAFKVIGEKIRPGMTTMDIDSIVEQTTLKVYTDISFLVIVPLFYFILKHVLISIGFNVAALPVILLEVKAIVPVSFGNV